MRNTAPRMRNVGYSQYVNANLIRNRMARSSSQGTLDYDQSALTVAESLGGVKVSLFHPQVTVAVNA